MTQIICLANSWKRGDRCIAGINPKNAQWIRPVSNLPDGKIPREMRLINAMEPALLDILEIPLASTGPDYGFESENRSVLPGKWQKIGKITSSDIVKYLSNEEYILHNKLRYVTVSYMQSLPPAQRNTLQLVKALIFTVKAIGKRVEGLEKWEGTILTPNNQKLTATITDPVFIRRLELGYRPEKPCLVTVSLSMPWRPSDWEGDDPSWKLIAGVMELPEELNEDEIPF